LIYELIPLLKKHLGLELDKLEINENYDEDPKVNDEFEEV